MSDPRNIPPRMTEPKKSSSLPIVIGGLVIVAALAYFLMSGGVDRSALAPAIETPATTEAPAATPAPDATVPATPAAPAETAPSAPATPPAAPANP